MWIILHMSKNTIKLPLPPQFKAGLLSDAQSGDSPNMTSPLDTTCIDELKKAFELVEVSSPGISDQLLTRIYVHLQHRYDIHMYINNYHVLIIEKSGTRVDHPPKSSSFFIFIFGTF